MNKLISLAFLLAACAAPTAPAAKVKGATTMEKGTANKAASYAKKTAPAGATSMGMMSSPKAGNTTIPITNVEVYVFDANIDETEGDETLYWAYDVDSDTAYVWGQIGLDCVDDNGDPTGETGSADFVYEDGPNGSGWLTATDACGYSTLFGCSDDGTGEVCGGCDWNDTAIVCTSDE